MRSCQIYNAQRTRRSRISDHNPILLHLDVLTTPVPIPKEDPVPQALPPRLLFRCERLKDPIILAKFTASLEHYAQKLLDPLLELKTKALTGLITPQSFADQFNDMITKSIHR